MALVQKIGVSFLLSLGKTTFLCHPAAKSSPTLNIFIAQDGRNTSLWRTWQQESPDCCFLRWFKGTQSSTPRPCLLTALCTHGISSYHCFFLPRLLLKIITGGSNIKPACPFSLLSLLKGKWKSLPFVWICVSASQWMKLWSLPDGEWL